MKTIHLHPGQIIETETAGGSHFGSGGYYCSSKLKGGEILKESVKSNSFITQKIMRIRMQPGDKLTIREGDCVGDEGRDWSRQYVCVTWAKWVELPEVQKHLQQVGRAFEALVTAVVEGEKILAKRREAKIAIAASWGRSGGRARRRRVSAEKILRGVQNAN